MPDKFFFYSKSADAKPGKGSKEEGNPNDYKKLSTIKDWRKILSNFWISPFECEGKRWNSVEHYYHSCKFKGSFRYQFSLDSGSSFSVDPAMAKGAGGKSGKFKGKLLRPVSIKSDMTTFNTDRAFTVSMFCKFTQSDKLREILLDTGEAQLWHIVSRSPKPVRFIWLERIRNCIRKFPHLDLSELSKRLKY
jgi:predicted NAD-dependent protein-ADP-ribosyltransferase YbiA (DUF1768 family)